MKTVKRLAEHIADTPVVAIIVVAYVGMGTAIAGIGLENGAPVPVAVGAAVITILGALIIGTLLGLLFEGDPLMLWRSN